MRALSRILGHLRRWPAPSARRTLASRAAWTRLMEGGGDGGGGRVGNGHRPPGLYEKLYPRGWRKGVHPEEQGLLKRQSEPRGGHGSNGDGDGDKSKWRRLAVVGAGLAVALLLGSGAGDEVGGGGDAPRTISFQEFRHDYLERGLVSRVEVVNRNVARVYLKPGATDPRGMPLDGPQRPALKFAVPSVDLLERRMIAAQTAAGVDVTDLVPVVYTSKMSWLSTLISWSPTLLIIAGYLYVMQRLGGLGGRGGRFPMGGGGARSGGAAGRGSGIGGILGVGRAGVTVLNKDGKNRVTTRFSDVAGLDEAKAEILEFVSYLKQPERYKRIGARIPKGALMYGPPGTGKTLLAKATAGEADVPFLTMSGSDFMELFVGVGPSRVRDLFAQARQLAPCIVFIDEIDAIGRSRGRGGLIGGNDERENTLNQLLVEMDGFAPNSGVVVLGGTNRVDVLDPALLRPGRFDRQILIDPPDVRGRSQIFQVHLRPVKVARDLDKAELAKQLAARTPGFTGADIANVCNEAALVAARAGADGVSLEHLEAAIDRVIGGLEKRSMVMSPEEKRTVAYHEAGHAVAGWFLEHAMPLIKVSIVPRGSAALGYAQYQPRDQQLFSREQLQDTMCMTLAGRVAEEIFFGRVTTGAADDFNKVSSMAYSQVTQWGMGESLGHLAFRRSNDETAPRFYKPYSNQTASLIDDEVRRLVHSAHERTRTLVQAHRHHVELVAQELLTNEVITRAVMERLLGQRPFAERLTYDQLTTDTA
ncbi:hypothetical protein CDCA_CDCA06G2008 [Cyanidium caldarium]|uniref:AAA+ ATPase domain-containing protein n=1 Tax=Cyanidium caldarium TaxID=2771 RepID=A0AAV9IW02_CYACA|nr:hypothetical protein CDCA_CDCA06G2008 [Cyanidium caldarium]